MSKLTNFRYLVLSSALTGEKRNPRIFILKKLELENLEFSFLEANPLHTCGSTVCVGEIRTKKSDTLSTSRLSFLKLHKRINGSSECLAIHLIVASAVVICDTVCFTALVSVCTWRGRKRRCWSRAGFEKSCCP